METVVIVSDAHLGQAPNAVTDSFRSFLRHVPELGNHLIINGDLFDFWFEYRSVIPRRTFAVLSDLLQVRAAGVDLTITGGNHDRWGGDFWRDELGARYDAGSIELKLAGWRALVAHGDGLCERSMASQLLNTITRLPATSAVFRMIHPDAGFRLARRLSRAFAENTRRGPTLDAAAGAQASYARRLLAKRDDLDLVVLSHTHRPALESVGTNRWYLNPGAWMEGLRYALIGQQGPALCQYSPD